MVQPPNESQQTRTFSVDHENVLPDHYRLAELIGRGGMAEVYLAEDRRLGRKVAIKFLTAEFRRDPDRVRRFRQEARSASALNHPNILIIHDIGDRGGVQFIVSEFVEGETLGTRIAQGRIPFAEAVDIAIQAASALTAAHAAGIVHRDIKPDNIMIRHDGVVKVLDFGLAKARGFSTLNGADFDATTLDSGSTSPGLIVGTPQYMSPEQARGKELDGRTDIFSLGIIIFEMVTRHSPFAGGSFADTMAAILTKEPRQMAEFVEDAPPRLVELVEKCLRKEPDDRFSSMAEVESELKLLRSELTEHPRTTTEVDPARSDRTQIRPTHQHSIRRFVSGTFVHRSSIATGIIFIAAVLLAGGWWAWDRWSPDSRPPSTLRTVPITSWSSSSGELVTAASFAPEGRMIAFAARKAEFSELFVKPIVGGDAIQITKGGFNQYPVWSPDGQEIAYFGGRNTWGLYRISFTGGDAVRILSDAEPSARPIRWTASGKVYYQSKSDIFAVDINSGQNARITNFEQSGITPRTIEISADEKRVAFSVKEADGWKVKIGSAGGEKFDTIATSMDQIDYISWHANSASVLCSISVDGAFQIFEAGPGRQIPEQRSTGNMDFHVQDVSSDGRILYSSLSEAADVWSVGVRDLEEKIVANDITAEYWPDVAPDGRIAYQSVAQVGRAFKGTIRIVGEAGEQEKSSFHHGFSPIWSPDGQWISYLRRVGAGIELWKARPNGDAPTRLASPTVTPPGYMATPYIKTGGNAFSWSSDTSKIAYVASVDGWSNIYVTNAAVDEPVKVTNNESDKVFYCCPIWTFDNSSIIFTTDSYVDSPVRQAGTTIGLSSIGPGETRILFESRSRIRILGISSDGSEVLFIQRSDPKDLAPAPKSTDVFSLSLTSGRVTKLNTIEGAFFHNVHLSRDSRWIAFVGQNGTRTALSIVGIRGGSVKELVVETDPKILFSGLAWTPDGGSIVFGRQTRTSLLSMLSE